MLKKVGFGIILWAIPFMVAIPLMSLMQSDPVFFKTIMIVAASAVGCALAAIYFRNLEGDFLREGLWLGAVWVAVNWILDFVVLLPLSGMTLSRYFLEIGFRYPAIAFTTVAIGYVLQDRQRRG